MLEHGIRSLRFFKKGEGMIISMGMTDFRFDIELDKPLLFLKLDFPIVIQSDRIVIRAENEAQAHDLIDEFIRLYDPTSAVVLKKEDPKELIKRSEDQDLEFKSSLRYNTYTGEKDPALEKACLKTICGFLNAQRGILLIGVSDEKKDNWT